MYCDLEAMITKVNRAKIQNKSAHIPIAVGAITVSTKYIMRTGNVLDGAVYQEQIQRVRDDT